MAYVPNEEEEKQEANGGSQPGLLGGGRQSGGPSRSSFVNVSEYLDKNPNEGENLVGRVVGNLEQERNDTQSAVNSANTEFGNRVNSSSVNPDQDFLNSAFSKPEEFVQNNDNVARFEAMKNAAYNGPMSFEETDLFAPVQSKVDALKTKGSSLGTEAGRNAVLSPLSAKPTAGKTALNQLILQGTPDAAKKLETAAGTFPAVEEQWNQVRQQGGQQAQTAKTSTEAARAATNTGLKNTTDTFKSGLNTKLTQATTDRDAFNSQYQALMSALMDQGGMNLRPEQLEKLGIKDAYPYLSKLNDFNQPRGLGYYNSATPLSSYVQPGQANSALPTLEGVADQGDYAREAALQQLSGSDLGLPDQMGERYAANGKMPAVDYMSAFNTAGSKLQDLDKSWTPKVAGYGPDDLSQLYAIQGRQSTPNYYSSPDVTATPTKDFGIAPAPTGWDPNTPPPYPVPTTQPAPNLINPQWNPYTGQWGGAQLQPNNPPPPPTDGQPRLFF